MEFSKEITFVIFTYNEQDRIERAVKNFCGVAKVLVVDNHSADRTREIAAAAGAEVLLHKNPGWVEDEYTVSVVKNAVTTPWIYWAYADEMIDYQTLNAIIEQIKKDQFSIVCLTRKNYFYGSFCHQAYANKLNRVFKKEAIDFKGNKIHGFGKPTVPESEICQLNSKIFFVHHFISNTAKSYCRTIDGYTDIECKTAKPSGLTKVIFRSIKGFLSNFFIQGGIRAGVHGFYLCIQMTYYEILLHMKTYELQQELSEKNIEFRNNAVRDLLLNDLFR